MSGNGLQLIGKMWSMDVILGGLGNFYIFFL